MKTKLTILSLLLSVGVVQGCNSGNQDKLQPVEINSKWRFITIDSCEYIENSWSSAAAITHKGNCKNPIHKVIQP